MSRNVIWTNQFKKDYKTAMKRGLPIEKLDEAIILLSNGDSLGVNYKDHELMGAWCGARECHIMSDWLLIYRIYDNGLVLSLVRTGTHSDLF